MLLLIVLAGAALGYWIVRKFVISEDGSVDVGVAQFVKWAMRVIAVTFIFQVMSCFGCVSLDLMEIAQKVQFCLNSCNSFLSTELQCF